MSITNKNFLPSNFCFHSGNEIVQNVIPISKSRNWVTEVRLPYRIKFEDYLDFTLKNSLGKSILFDGCNSNLTSYLQRFGFKSILVGKEAVFDFSINHFSKKSLKELIRRGLKHGSVKELEFSDLNKKHVEDFKEVSAIAKTPKLQHLFCSSFESFTRLFVFQNDKNEWLALITVSQKSEKFSQTELILRRSKNPIGIMEALIFSIYNILKSEGKEFWTLGAVPFVVNPAFSFTKESLINFIGKRLRFAYNYKGLFNFKNKFNPTWIDYYICYNNKISYLELINLMRKTRLLHLVISKIFLKFWK